MKKNNLCIVYPNKILTYSETFIQEHLNRIEHEHTLTGGRLAFLDKDNNTIFKPFLLRINLIRGFTKRLFPNLYQKFYTQSLISYIKENNITHILAEYGPTGVALADACVQTGVKLTVHFHGYDASDKGIIKMYKSFYKDFSSSAHKVVVVSDPMKNQLESLGVSSEIIEKIGYGVNIDLFKQAEPEKNIKNFVAVGRFTHKKSPLSTIRAFEQVLQKHSDCKLTMVGEGELFEEAKKEIQSKNLEDSILLLGKRTPNEIVEILKQSGCFVQHSVVAPGGDSEGSPNSIIEALSAGLPVVSTIHAGIPEMVKHGENGFLVEEHDVDGMAKYMIKIVENPELAKKLGQNARGFIVDNRSIEVQIKKLESVIGIKN